MNIEEAAKAAGLKVGTNIGGVTLVGSPLPQSIAHITIEEMERFAKIIRNQALEEAAKVCDGVNNYSNPMTANDCADAIRAMKEQT
jgi:osmotically-inducible protein OsmY